MIQDDAELDLQHVVISMAYTFNDASAEERHITQYFEIMGNRGIYHNGWTAQTKHRTPWDVVSKAPDFSKDVWELYDTTKDWTQANNLADKYPEKLAEMQQLFLIEAVRHNVLPIDDRAKAMVVAGLSNKMAAFSNRLTPRSMQRATMGRIMGP